jgi:hypothetical protein
MNYKLLSASVLGGIAIASLCSIPASAVPVPLRINNQCDHPIRLAVLAFRFNRNIRPEYGGWTQPFEGGWWQIPPRTQTTLIFHGETIEIDPSANGSVKYYAETTDGSGGVWRGGTSMRNPRTTSNLPNPLRLPDGSLLPYRDAYPNSEGVFTIPPCPRR